MKSIFETDHPRPARVAARNLDRVLDGFGTAINKQRFLGKVPRRQGIQPLCQTDITFVGGNVEAGVEETVKLCPDRLDHGARAVPNIQTAQAAGEVNEPIAIHVLEHGALRSGNKDRGHVVSALRDGCLAALHPFA